MSTPPTPPGAWTALDIPAQGGRIAVVTGANRGLGLITARELARAGATVVLGCRSPERGRAAIEALRTEVPGAAVEVGSIDLGDLSSIERFADDLGRRYDHLDLLVHNAAVSYTRRSLTADGFELQLGTNHLGPFALTGRVLGLMTEVGARVVTVTSVEHKRGHLHLDDLMLERRYGRYRAYRQSKLANASFGLELDRRLRAAGREVGSVLAHPGYADTIVGSAGQAPPDRVVAAVAKRLLAQRAPMGALPQLYDATAPGVTGGDFVGPDGFGELRGHPTVVRAADEARDPHAARRLWARSEQLTGVTFDRLLG